MNIRKAGLLVCFAAACGAQEPGAGRRFSVNLGGLTITPGGLLNLNGESRSAATINSVATSFGNIPLTAEAGQSLITMRDSRLDLKGQIPVGNVQFDAYLESDFMNFTAGQSPWRWRQYWGQARAGKWEILGGQAWSLLRPNRKGISSDQGLMHTDVIDPAYQVGLLGSRVRQVRLARTLGDYMAVFAWESRGNWVAKATVDKKRGHAELAALIGHGERRGVMAAGVVNLSERLQFVTQEYWSKRAASEALGVVPAGINGEATIQGLEFHPAKAFEIYSYGGLVCAARSPGNRLVREWTVGGDYRLAIPSMLGNLHFSLQFSQMDRLVWTGQSGAMTFVMCRVRYAFN